VNHFFVFFRKALGLFAFSVVSIFPAYGLVIDIRKGVISSIPLGFQGLEGCSEASDMMQVVENDLKNSGVFQILTQRGSQSPSEAMKSPEFAQWSLAGEGTVLLSGVVFQQDGLLVAECKIYDVQTKALLSTVQLKEKSSHWRLLAHKIANEVYHRLTGEPGYFDTQIVYTAQYGSALNKKKRIAIIDQDGANCRFLTSGRNMELTPRCCQATGKIAYCAFHNYKSVTHVMDLKTGADQALPISGISISPRFSPDGRNLVVCLAKGNATSIYLFNLASKALSKLTTTNGNIDVSPSYSPDGKFLVFASDRQGGRPKLYVMPSSGHGNPVCISSGAGGYHAPVWSPDGRWIAFVKNQQGSYYLGVVAPDGTQERLIATDHVIDRPSFAPNSRLLIFAAQNKRFGPFHLYIVDLSGRSLRKLETAHEGSIHEGNHPDWSCRPSL
jgi:TolB protein